MYFALQIINEETRVTAELASMKRRKTDVEAALAKERAGKQDSVSGWTQAANLEGQQATGSTFQAYGVCIYGVCCSTSDSNTADVTGHLLAS
jgi:hypothetical protein